MATSELISFRQRMEARRKSLSEQLQAVDELLADIDRMEAKRRKVEEPFIPAEEEGDWSHLGIVEGARRLLQVRGPMSSRDIVERLKSHGLRSDSERPTSALYASLVGSPDIRRNKKGPHKGKWEYYPKEAIASS